MGGVSATRIGPWLRVELLHLMHAMEQHGAGVPHWPHGVGLASLEQSGTLREQQWDAADCAIAFREMVAIGHATTEDGFRHFTTEAGRLWYQAERAAEQSRTDALARAAEQERQYGSCACGRVPEYALCDFCGWRGLSEPTP